MTKKTTFEKHSNVLPEILGYQLVTPFCNTNSGFARWAFAEKNGRHYFIKEFLSPVCPQSSSELPQSLLEQKRSICDNYYREKLSLYQAINRSATGNIVTINAFFFHNTRFYIVTDKIDSMNCTIDQVAAMEPLSKILLLKVLSYCLAHLHQNGVVHADLKPNNVLLKKTPAGNITAKIIDFDGSFLVGEQPQNEIIQGDQVYLAPETCKAILGENVLLTPKIDVFSLGLLFHQYYTGHLPYFDAAYDYAHEALLDGEKLLLDPSIPPDLANIVSLMLSLNPDERPSMDMVYQSIQSSTPMVLSPHTDSVKQGVESKDNSQDIWKRPIAF